MAVEQEVGELGPVVGVEVGDYGYLGVGEDVADAAQLEGADALGLVVDDADEALSIEGEADGDDVRLALGRGGGQVGYALAQEEGALGGR